MNWYGSLILVLGMHLCCAQEEKIQAAKQTIRDVLTDNGENSNISKWQIVSDEKNYHLCIGTYNLGGPLLQNRFLVVEKKYRYCMPVYKVWTCLDLLEPKQKQDLKVKKSKKIYNALHYLARASETYVLED
jgi:hypothetical protein